MSTITTLEKETEADVFYLGICMAGAVSAGAYTAGVMDYLTEALAKYENKRGQDGVPSHPIRIPVMGGASAGGMTGVITAAAAQQNMKPVTSPPADPQTEIKENPLYHSWVDLLKPDMFPLMMDNSDIGKGETYSLFNSDFIEKIAERVLEQKDIQWNPLPPYFSGKLKVFVTLSNLEGFSYDVAFKAAQQNKAHPYYMQIHNDYACFQICQGQQQCADAGWIPLNFAKNLNTAVAVQAAMATGAFPAGLRARTLERTTASVNANPFLSEYLKQNPVTCSPYTSLNVDGGMINNEPFEYVREVLKEVSGQQDNTEYEDVNHFNSTIIMIAPFPNVKPASITFVQNLLHVLGLTVTAVMSQMRAKPAQLADAMDDDCAGQFLIDPSRPGADGKSRIQGQKAIACGAVDGFSGFLSKDFRVHDYFLGRYNCYIFLRDYFTIPDTARQQNPVFQKGYKDADPEKFRSHVDGSLQILPVIDPTPPVIPNWPVKEWQDFERFRPAIKARFSKLLLNIVKLRPLNRVLLWIGCRVVLQRLVSTIVLNKIKAELCAWKLLDPKQCNPEEITVSTKH